MKKAFFILIPIIVLAFYMSRPLPIKVEIQPKPESIPEVKTVEPVTLRVSPEVVYQGDPVLITVQGLGTSTIKSLKFNNSSFPIFTYQSKPTILVGMDLRLVPGTYLALLTLSDGRIVKKSIVVKEKYKEVAPLGIPDSLGGNTPESEQELISSLEAEAKIINAIKTSDKKLWEGDFLLPLAPPITITDVYGYSRQTGGSTIAHKGTDFRAAVGTPVSAINDGRVAYVGYLRNYGNVIAVDHGTKVLSLYMHLSRVDVGLGKEVKRGEQLALSGETGYVLGPHLHLTIRINNISIDPEKFYKLLGS